MKEIKIYRCSVCLKIIYVLKDGIGELVCCDKPMNLLKLNDSDGAKEKHIPFIKTENNNNKIQIGEIIHPMTEEHFIEWIGIFGEEKVEFNFLKPNQEPIIKSNFSNESKILDYCNIHGLWIKK